MRVFERSCEIGETLDDERGLAFSLVLLGKALLKCREHTAAERHLMRAFQIHLRLHDQRGLDVGTPPLVEALQLAGKSDQALHCCDQAAMAFPSNRKLQLRRTSLSSVSQWRTGTVKFVHRTQRGRHGFIVPDDGGIDIYYDDSSLSADGLARLMKGTKARVQVEIGPRGPRARRVELLE